VLKFGKMKYFLLALTLFFSFMLPMQAGAKELKDDSFIISGAAKLTNLETGEVQEVELTDINKSTRVYLGGNNYEQSIETKFKIPSEISSFSTGGADRDNGDVSANITLNYDYSSSTNEIRINVLSGSWTPQNSYIVIDNRKAGCHDGRPSGNSITRYPTSNTFTAFTGWGYVPYYPGSPPVSGVRAYSEARVIVPGMGSGYTLALDFYLQNP
jgi:hypothetical protein